MKKNYFLIIIYCLMISSAQAQEKLITRSGHISFFSEAPLENIEAHNHQVSGILDTKSGEVAAIVMIKNFDFKKALMQEHFNENYMESDKYPRATLKGKIKNWEKVNLHKLGNKILVTDLAGEISIHGVTKPFKSKVYFSQKEGYINGQSEFKIKVKDFDIQIPKLMLFNIAEEVLVEVDFIMEPYEP